MFFGQFRPFLTLFYPKIAVWFLTTLTDPPPDLVKDQTIYVFFMQPSLPNPLSPSALKIGNK